MATLDETNCNRGLLFDGEMASYCGRTARVQARVNRLIEESTGEMIEIKSDCIILEGVVCAANYYRFCTRAIYSYWREIWLEKIDAPEDNQVTAPASRPAGAGCEHRTRCRTSPALRDSSSTGATGWLSSRGCRSGSHRRRSASG